MLISQFSYYFIRFLNKLCRTAKFFIQSFLILEVFRSNHMLNQCQYILKNVRLILNLVYNILDLRRLLLDCLQIYLVEYFIK